MPQQASASIENLDRSDEHLFKRLREELHRQIANFAYEVPTNAIGKPLPEATIAAYLNSMISCLVEPRWEEALICTPTGSLTGTGEIRRCVTMAEDDAYVLIFEPTTAEYHLAWRSSQGLSTWGIRGNGVDCFIAR